MPFDLAAIERGYGETECDWNGHTIVLRYHARLDNRALIAVKRALVGVTALDGKTKIPDVEMIIETLLATLRPSGPEIPPEERGWDLTDGGEPLPITFDTLVDLPPGLPGVMLGQLFRDVNDPNRRRPSSAGSSRGAASAAPTPSPTTTASSPTPNGQASPPGDSPDMTIVRLPGLAGGAGSAS